MLQAATFDHLAKAMLARYPASCRGRLQLLCLSENATYAVQGDGIRHVLRLHRPAYHSAQAIRSELHWLDALRASGVEVPKALPGLDGDCLQQLELAGQERHAVLFEWIDGTEPDPRQNLLASFERLGAINARLHRQARDWPLPTGFERLRWDHTSMLGADGHWGDWRQAPNLNAAQQPLIEATLLRLGEELAAYGQSSERFGLIHADLRLANLLVQGERTRVIDFDDCGFGWYLHDLASALSFHEDHPDVPRWVSHWLQGYTREHGLSDAELAMIPAFVVQRRLQLLAWTGTHAETRTVQELGPDWASRCLPLCEAYLEGRLRLY